MIIRSQTRVRALAIPRRCSGAALAAISTLRQRPRRRQVQKRVRRQGSLALRLAVLLTRNLAIPPPHHLGQRLLHRQLRLPHSRLEVLPRHQLVLPLRMLSVLVLAILAASSGPTPDNKEVDCLDKSKDSSHSQLQQRQPLVASLRQPAISLETWQQPLVAVSLAISLPAPDHQPFKVLISHQKPQTMPLQLLRPLKHQNHSSTSAKPHPPPLHPYLAIRHHQIKLHLPSSLSQVQPPPTLPLSNRHSLFQLRMQQLQVLLVQLQRQRPLLQVCQPRFWESARPQHHSLLQRMLSAVAACSNLNLLQAPRQTLEAPQQQQLLVSLRQVYSKA
jgi:hypothetical protein